MGFFDAKERISRSDINNSVLTLEKNILDTLEALNEKVNVTGLMIQELYQSHKGYVPIPAMEKPKENKLQKMMEKENMSLEELKKYISEVET